MGLVRQGLEITAKIEQLLTAVDNRIEEDWGLNSQIAADEGYLD